MAWHEGETDKKEGSGVDSKHPHLGAVVGVCAVDSTPQVVTADSLGQLKIWDMYAASGR